MKPFLKNIFHRRALRDLTFGVDSWNNLAYLVDHKETSGKTVMLTELLLKVPDADGNLLKFFHEHDTRVAELPLSEVWPASYMDLKLVFWGDICALTQLELIILLNR